ncbi:unnamed protein product [Discula destructiva]
MKITLYVDVVSPFAYVAYHVFRHDPIFKKCQMTYIPIFLGGVMKQAGNTAPINIKNKDKWIMTERTRWARYFNVPIIAETPPNFPPLTLTVMRAVNAISHLSDHEQTSPEAQRAIIKALDAFYDAYWVQGQLITDKDVLSSVLGKVVDGDPAKVAKILEVASGEGKQMLLKNSDLAFAEGAFGLPWMVCENDRGEKEGFWGVDHLGCVLDFMGLEKPRTGGWKAML